MDINQCEVGSNISVSSGSLLWLFESWEVVCEVLAWSHFCKCLKVVLGVGLAESEVQHGVVEDLLVVASRVFVQKL